MIRSIDRNLSTLCSDLLLQWGGEISQTKTTDEDEIGADATLEDFLRARLNSDAKAYIYERECPFMSKDTLDAYFGNIAFIQHTLSMQPNTFNVRLIDDCCEEDIFRLVNYYDSSSRSSRIIRIGMLKYFFAEGFDPFQETMKRILATVPAKKWMEEALNKTGNPVKKQLDLVFSFVNGRLIAIL